MDDRMRNTTVLFFKITTLERQKKEFRIKVVLSGNLLALSRSGNDITREKKSKYFSRQLV